MNITLLIVLALINVSGWIGKERAQAPDEMYLNAMHFLSKEFKKDTFFRLKENCLHHVNVVDSLGFSQLNVSERKLRNSVNAVFCDLLEKRYTFNENCGKLIASHPEKIKFIEDSLTQKVAEYNLAEPKNTTHKFIRKIASRHESGLVVFFSSIYECTLSAEVMSFCTSYKQSTWQGASEIYYFVFERSGEIKEVYRGKRYYN